ncbi:MAG TPA: SDR family NAD(P)-dependent oxidoreductase [Thermoanaerobaculia bacterium]|nr:SDR family NAD(P)-dependent oxidoreductase [Thermoanaerobaculia bacterium]
MKRAVITGASSGIGLALARELSQRGYAVALLARRGDLLDQLAKELPHTVAIVCDVTDRESVERSVRQAEESLGGGFEVAVANAGVGIPTWAAEFNTEDADRVIRVNLLGMIYLFGAVIPGMVERRAGRFAGIASIAGLRGLPSASAYSASKAGMQAFLEASRVELAPFGVAVTIVNPGFIQTAMVEKYRSRLPFLMQVGPAARKIADGIEGGQREVEFPFPMSMAMRTARLLPNALYDRLLRPYGQRRIDRTKVRR